MFWSGGLPRRIGVVPVSRSRQAPPRGRCPSRANRKLSNSTPFPRPRGLCQRRHRGPGGGNSPLGAPGPVPPTSAVGDARREGGRPETGSSRRHLSKTGETTVMSGRCVPPFVGRVQRVDIAGADLPPRSGGSRFSNAAIHRAEMHRQCAAHWPPARRHGRRRRSGKSSPFLDVDRMCGVLQRKRPSARRCFMKRLLKTSSRIGSALDRARG